MNKNWHSISCYLKNSPNVKEAEKQSEEMINKTQIDCDEKRRMTNIDLEAAKSEIERLRRNLQSMKLDVLSAMEKYKTELEKIALSHK